MIEHVGNNEQGWWKTVVSETVLVNSILSIVKPKALRRTYGLPGVYPFLRTKSQTKNPSITFASEVSCKHNLV